MKLQCLKCDAEYFAALGKCPSCGSQGGYCINISLKKVGDREFNRLDILKHEDSGVLYKVREFQLEGAIATIEEVPLPALKHLENKRVYISYTSFDEYKHL